MISWNGIAVAHRRGMATLRTDIGREAVRRFMLPAANAAVRGKIDFAFISEPDAAPGPAGDRPLLVGLSDVSGGRDGCGYGPDAWSTVRYLKAVPPALVVLDTALSVEAWQAMVDQMPGLRRLLIVLCRPEAVPAWRETFADAAPVRAIIPGQACA